jgi:aminoglycoside phosphotransferase (APT) family kinase protein
MGTFPTIRRSRVHNQGPNVTVADINTPAPAPDASSQLLSPLTVAAYLAERGVISDPVGARAHELAGGVSNVVLAVTAGSARVVVKQALPRLRVADEWLAKRERALTEAAALELASRIVPACVPTLLDLDRDRCVLTITAAPVHWTTWKSRLLRGEADPAIARRLGELLAAWHQGTFRDEAVLERFGDTEAFEQLRIDPYYRTVARRRPELAAAIGAVLARMEATRVCLVHGDYSPKNVLVGEGVWAIDFEVAHCGDPAFDLAFMLNHLLLKRLHAPEASVELDRCAAGFWESYTNGVAGELLPETRYVLGHVGGLMLARVEGKSPAEYLSAAERETAWALGTRLLLDPPDSLAAMLGLVGGAEG